MGPSPSVLTAEAVGVSFGGLRALDGVSLEAAPAEIVGLIGPNGAGKTTLFDCLTGLQPCEGRIVLAGRELTGAPVHVRAATGLARSFQDARLFPSLTVEDTLRVAYELHHRDRAVAAAALGLPALRRAERRATEQADRVVGLLGLDGYRNALIRHLSTGTRRIVDLGCVVVREPTVILFDEPSSGIAQREAEALGGLLRRIRDITGAAVVIIEHDMPLLLGLAERLYALESGRVVAEGDPTEVIRHPEVVRSYLGDDPAAISRSGALPAGSPAKSRRSQPVASGAVLTAPANGHRAPEATWTS